METVRTTCPRDCYDACGVLVAIEDGRIKHVRGDPGASRLARQALPQVLDRLQRRLPRSGAAPDDAAAPQRAEGRGAVRADRLARGDRGGRRAASAAIAAEHGAASVLNAHYTGTCALIDGAFPQRFFNRLGATEVEPDTVCNNAGHVALSYVYGSSEEGFDPEAAADAACIVVWGANPSASAPHAHDHWLREARGEVIVIDPIRTPSAAAADTYLQLRPGSDAALAFALAHVIRRDGLVDDAFVRECVLGYDELEPLLEPCTPAWARGAHRRAGEPDRARRARLRRGPSLLWMGQGLQRQPRGGNVMRAIAMLPALTGQHPPARLGVPVPQRRRVARDRLRLAGGRRARAPTARRPRSARWIWPRCSPIPRRAARSCAGTSTRWPRAPSRRRCARRSRATTC